MITQIGLVPPEAIKKAFVSLSRDKGQNLCGTTLVALQYPAGRSKANNEAIRPGLLVVQPGRSRVIFPRFVTPPFHLPAALWAD